jgi:aerobic C4-dicarboxylate transport protein
MTQTAAAERGRRDRTHHLYLAVIAAVVLGAVTGLVAPGFAVGLQPIGEAFVDLIKMMIAPVIYCTIVLGIGSIRSAAKVGRVGGLALGYFLVMSTFALAIGLVVGNILHPGSGLHLTHELASTGQAQAGEPTSTSDFLLSVVPTSLLSSLTDGQVLQTLLVALLAGFALQAMGRTGEPILRGIEHEQRLVFRILAMIMWAAPVGAFGAIAAVVGEPGVDALKSLAVLMLGFYTTCALFVFVVLGTVLRLTAGVNVFTLLRYLAREFLLILSTSSSESALPRLIAKMEHAGVERTTVGIDRFMSEARALTNFAGNAIATVVIGAFTGSLDRARMARVLAGREPFDEATMLDDQPPLDGPVAEPGARPVAEPALS